MNSEQFIKTNIIPKICINNSLFSELKITTSFSVHGAGAGAEANTIWPEPDPTKLTYWF